MDITRNELIFFIAALLAIVSVGFMTTREVDEKKFSYRVDLISEDGLRDATIYTNERASFENCVLKIGNTEVKGVRALITEL